MKVAGSSVARGVRGQSPTLIKDLVFEKSTNMAKICSPGRWDNSVLARPSGSPFFSCFIHFSAPPPQKRPLLRHWYQEVFVCPKFSTSHPGLRRVR